MNDYCVEQYLKGMFILEINTKHSFSQHSVANLIEHFITSANEFNSMDLTKYTFKKEFNNYKIRSAFQRKFRIYENCFEALFYMKYLAP